MTITEDEAENVIRQICEGNCYYDPDSEYYNGESRKYFFYRAEESFNVQKMDFVVGAYCTTEEVSRIVLKDFLMTQHASDFLEQGFVL